MHRILNIFAKKHADATQVVNTDPEGSVMEAWKRLSRRFRAALSILEETGDVGNKVGQNGDLFCLSP